MKKIQFHTFLIALGLFAQVFAGPALFAAEVKRGEMGGGVMHTAPGWFKESFLEIRDDVDEATEADKHVMLFFQLNGCPYCDRMLRESFETEPMTSYIQEHFDTIAINVGGDREIAFNDEISVIEKELAEMLKVRATPAILFLDSDNKTVVRVNGYRAPERFQQVLNYVAEKAYAQQSLAEYMDSHLPKEAYQLRDNALFTQTMDLSTVSGPLMLIFEDGGCYDCNELHDRLLAQDDVRKELEPYTIVRLDADSEQELIDIDGQKTTPRALASKHEVIYRPGILVFDDGELIRRYDSLLYSYHFKEGLRYVAGGYYKKEPYRDYSRRRREELLAAGVDINLAE